MLLPSGAIHHTSILDNMYCIIRFVLTAAFADDTAGPGQQYFVRLQNSVVRAAVEDRLSAGVGQDGACLSHGFAEQIMQGRNCGDHLV